MSRSIKAVRTRAPVVQTPKPRRDWQKDYEWYHANSSMFGNPNEGDTEEAERTVTNPECDCAAYAKVGFCSCIDIS